MNFTEKKVYDIQIRDNKLRLELNDLITIEYDSPYSRGIQAVTGRFIEICSFGQDNDSKVYALKLDISKEYWADYVNINIKNITYITKK
jgi:hypothetical protein